MTDELRPDDPQPVTEEWLTKVLGEPSQRLPLSTIWPFSVRCVFFRHNPDPAMHYCTIGGIPKQLTTTRGDFRWVCERLKIQLREDG